MAFENARFRIYDVEKLKLSKPPSVGHKIGSHCLFIHILRQRLECMVEGLTSDVGICLLSRAKHTKNFCWMGVVQREGLPLTVIKKLGRLHDLALNNEN